jgi:hypothetical protein
MNVNGKQLDVGMFSLTNEYGSAMPVWPYVLRYVLHFDRHCQLGPSCISIVNLAITA